LHHPRVGVCDELSQQSEQSGVAGTLGPNRVAFSGKHVMCVAFRPIPTRFSIQNERKGFQRVSLVHPSPTAVYFAQNCRNEHELISAMELDSYYPSHHSDYFWGSLPRACLVVLCQCTFGPNSLRLAAGCPVVVWLHPSLMMKCFQTYADLVAFSCLVSLIKIQGSIWGAHILAESLGVLPVIPVRG
jgi:hypothetical protein